MSWYLTAIVVFAESLVPDFKINTAVKFSSELACIEYVKVYNESLKGGLHRAFPGIVSSEFICVDQETANKMHDDMLNRG